MRMFSSLTESTFMPDQIVYQSFSGNNIDYLLEKFYFSQKFLMLWMVKIFITQVISCEQLFCHSCILSIFQMSQKIQGHCLLNKVKEVD